MAEKHAMTDRCDTGMVTEAGEEVGTLNYTQGRRRGFRNIYPKDSDEEAIMDFVKDHEELQDKANEHCREKARKQCLCLQPQSVCQSVQDLV